MKIDNPLGHCANSHVGQRLIAISAAAVSKGDHVDIKVGRTGAVLKVVEEQLTDTILHSDDYISLPPNLKFMIVQGAVSEIFSIDSVNPVTNMFRAANLANDYPASAKIYAISASFIFPFYSTLPYHFITDSRPDQALFEQLTLKSGDLQVGDHIYVINHPLYREYYPKGAWGGEHAFVMEISGRDSTGNAFKNDLKVEGHGLLFKSLLEMSKEMLVYVNKVLSILQAITPTHRNYLKTNGRASGTLGSFQVTFAQRKVGTDPATAVDVNVFQYNGKYTYTFISDGKKISHDSPGFVIMELTSNQDTEFRIINSSGTDSTFDPKNPPPVLRVAFNGSGSPASSNLSDWAAPWFNPQTCRLEFLPLFDTDNKTPTSLTFDNLLITKPFYATDDQGDVYVTRPRVDFSATYQTFLKNNGAI